MLFKKHIRIKVFKTDTGYTAIANNGQCAVANCYGTTKEKAKEMAIFKLKKAMETSLD